MQNDIYQVDAFTDRPFSGNPAGVMPMAEFADDGQLQAIAAEMNLSETAFVIPRSGYYDLRWFTPTMEVDLCGHATLATAHVLWETKRLSCTAEAVFQTRSGQLLARRSPDGIELDFPTLSVRDVTAPEGLVEALGVKPIYIGLSKFDYLVQLATANEVRQADVDFGKLSAIATRGVIVTSTSDDSKFDFISRFFAPAVGVDEDPVTGSSHCVLGAFWQSKLGRSTLKAYQSSPRGGSMTVRVDGATTHLIGRAITVLQGHFLY